MNCLCECRPRDFYSIFFYVCSFTSASFYIRSHSTVHPKPAYTCAQNLLRRPPRSWRNPDGTWQGSGRKVPTPASGRRCRIWKNAPHSRCRLPPPAAMVSSAAGRAAEVSVERRHILGISRGTFARIPIVIICHRLFLHPQSISASSEDILQIKRYHKVPFWPFTASFCTALLPVLPDPNCFFYSITSRTVRKGPPQRYFPPCRIRHPRSCNFHSRTQKFGQFSA